MSRFWWVPLAFVVFLLVQPAAADVQMPPDIDPLYRAECGSCHDAFPPQMLRKQDWQQILDGLDRHFGVNASLSADEVSRIAAVLVRYGAMDRAARMTPTDLHLTSTPYFRNHHAEVPVSAWTRPDVKRRSNCGACHPEADRGVFGHDAKVPGGP